MTENRTIGKTLLRREDYRFLTGQGRYLDDVVVPGALHAHFVRSPHAHARIRSIDIDARMRRLQELVDKALSLATGLSPDIKTLVMRPSEPNPCATVSDCTSPS